MEFDSQKVMDLFFQIATVIGTIRIFVKPIMAGLEQAIMQTPTKADDVWFQKLQASTSFQTFIFLLDYFGSLKVIELAELRRKQRAESAHEEE